MKRLSRSQGRTQSVVEAALRGAGSRHRSRSGELRSRFQRHRRIHAAGWTS